MASRCRLTPAVLLSHKGLRFQTLLTLLLTVVHFGNFAVAGLPETIDRIKPSLVAIGAVNKSRGQAFRAFGTGFVVGDGSLVVTNAHVTAVMGRLNEQEVLAVLVRGSGSETEVRQAREIASDPEHDLVLLKLDGPRMVPLPLGTTNAATVREGQSIAFSGFPLVGVFGPFPATNRGIISAITPIVIPGAQASQLNEKQIKRLSIGSFQIYQLDATAYPGSSGSPLYDADTGDIIGIINMVLVRGTKESALSQPSGITYAIPVRYLQALLRSVH